MKGVIDYCCQDKKVYDNFNKELISGINVTVKMHLQLTATSHTVKRRNEFISMFQSFSPDENITPQKAHGVALEFAEKAWTCYEVLVATHCDAQHIHSHFVINSVSFENGKKLRQNPNTLKSLQSIK